MKLPSGITIVMPEEQLICQITGVKVAASVAEALEGDGADGAEPEVINKGKEEEGEA